MRIVYLVVLLIALVSYISGIAFHIRAFKYKTDKMPAFPLFFHPKHYFNDVTEDWLTPHGHKLSRIGKYLLSLGTISLLIAVIFLDK